MEIVDVICMVLSAGAVLYVLAAFMVPPVRLDVVNKADRPESRAAGAIRDLEHDYAAGKLSSDDFDSAKRQTLEELAMALKTRESRSQNPEARMKSLILYVLSSAFLMTGLGSVSPAAEPSLTIRQHHLFFEFGQEGGQTVCGVQEIVVVESNLDKTYENPAGTIQFSVPAAAMQAGPAPIPPMMPGAESTLPLRPDEMDLTAGRIAIKRHLHPGKNTFAFAYLLPVEKDAVRYEKEILHPTRLMVSFAPDVERLTSRTFSVEKAEGGYKIMGSNLAAGTKVDLTFEGVQRVLSAREERRDGGGMGLGPADHPATPVPSPASLSRYALPTVSGVLLAILVFLYGHTLKASRDLRDRFRKFLMDEIESLDTASDRKEITAEFHKRQKKALMDRLRSLD